MSIAVPSRLAKDSSVLDHMAFRDQASAATSALSKQSPEDLRLEANDAGGEPEIFAVENKSRQAPETLLPEIVRREELTAAREQLDTNNAFFQQKDGDASKSRPIVNYEKDQGRGEKSTEPRLESFASALDYVLQHLAEEEGNNSADR